MPKERINPYHPPTSGTISKTTRLIYVRIPKRYRFIATTPFLCFLLLTLIIFLTKYYFLQSANYHLALQLIISYFIISIISFSSFEIYYNRFEQANSPIKWVYPFIYSSILLVIFFFAVNPIVVLMEIYISKPFPIGQLLSKNLYTPLASATNGFLNALISLMIPHVITIAFAHFLYYRASTAKNFTTKSLSQNA